MDMRKIQTLLTAGAAVLALATVSAFAGENPKMNEMSVRLPGGGVAHIEYTGDTPPRVVIGQSDPIFDAFWGLPPLMRFEPVADFDRLQQALERRVERILRDARALHADGPEAMIRVGDGSGPPSSFSYSFISTSSGGRTCSHSVQITTPASGGKPKVAEQTSGDCDALNVKSKPDNAAETL
jgi:hypothetical protein